MTHDIRAQSECCKLFVLLRPDSFLNKYSSFQRQITANEKNAVIVL